MMQRLATKSLKIDFVNRVPVAVRTVVFNSQASEDLVELGLRVAVATVAVVRVAVEVLAGQPAEFDNVAIPAVVFTDPEIAWCGLTETQAKAEGRKIKVARFPWAASGRAMTLDRTEGSTKLIFDPDSQRLLGVGIVGPGAGELIAEGVLAVEMGTVARDMADSIHPHPTTSETLMESAELFLGHATHVYRPKK